MKKVLLIAPVMSRSGYGEMGRFAMRAMMSDPNIDLYLHNINWGKTGWIWKDNEERRLIDSLLQKTVIYRQGGGHFDASVQCTIPNEWKKITPHDVGYTAGIETNQVAPVWLQKSNEMDRIVTISKHSADTLLNTTYQAQNQETGELIPEYRCTTPVEHVGFPVKDLTDCEISLDLRHDFNFLCVAQIGPRKNVEAVLNSFLDEFKDEEVGLLFKLNSQNDSVMDYYNVSSMFNNVTRTAKKDGWKCSVNLLHGNLTDEQMHGLYKHPKVKAFVSLTHGEGFGLPMYEAAYCKLPVIATGWSGHLDFLTTGKGKKTKKQFAAVKYELQEIPEHAVWNGVLHKGSKWAHPDTNDARKKMRDVFKNYSKWQKKANTLAKTFKGAQYWYEQFNEATGITSNTDDQSENILVI